MSNKQKFMHYAFQTILYSFGISTFGLIIYTFALIVQELN